MLLLHSDGDKLAHSHSLHIRMAEYELGTSPVQDETMPEVVVESHQCLSGTVGGSAVVMWRQGSALPRNPSQPFWETSGCLMYTAYTVVLNDVKRMAHISLVLLLC